ncbi:MAG: cell wall-binding repeat-containing protein [Microcella sp.]|uniref:cell wall-binding repeat-containing protein n=1 Tax=Microcella sp. TaxID=1913979 RepID=UPI0033156BD6
MSTLSRRLTPLSRPTIAALVAVLVTIASLGISPVATASTSGAIRGVVSGDPGADWDGLVRVRLSPVGGGTIVERNTDPETGEWSALLPVGSTWTIGYFYTGASNFLSRYEGEGDGNDAALRTQFTISADADTVVDRSLDVGATLTGTLAGTTGALATGQVTARQSRVFPGNTPRTQFDPATGAWRVDRLASGYVVLEFSSTTRWRTKSWSTNPAVSSTPIAVTAGEEQTGFDVALSPLATLAGTVTARIDDQPLRLIRAELLTASGVVRHVTSSLSTGAYEFTNVSPGTYTLCFSNVANLTDPLELRYRVLPSCYGEETQEGGTPITIAAEQWIDEVDLALSRNANLSGTVTTNDSLSSGPSQVNLFRETAPGSQFFALEAQTTSNFVGGGYVFYDLEPGNYVVSSRRSSSLFGNAVVYYPDARFFRDAEVISVSVDTDTVLDRINLNTQLLPLRVRHSGADRFATGTAITRQMFPPSAPESWSAPVVYIANGLNYPDALSAGPAAAHLGGALLLVRPTSIPADVQAELRRLTPERIVVVGGLGAVSSRVESQLRTFVADPRTQVSRLGGANRYDTGFAVVGDAFRGDDAIPEQTEAIFLASGANYPDALAAGPAASWSGGPVILLDPSQPRLPRQVREMIESLAPDYLYVVGGTGALPASIDADIDGLARIDEKRLSGANRYETSLLVNQAAFLFETEEAVLATGLGFADALSGGPFAAQLGAPLYLAPQTCIPLPALADMSALNVQRIHLLGGVGALSARVAALEIC